ncbi:MAG TPA: YqgE/AlgH family protein [Cellvibrionales bacterium]|jgi:putative transcriptional regulator|nr:YqgE/AlgH family protein [Cellvibrionales bacterium]HAW14283.1 YqgE/AlgH family protein [Cellvibrionales bacterium]HCX26820.1 YqgE/AlgH family protein [Cellvibrionales bacterium]
MSFVKSASLRNQFLIATPTLEDGIFKSSVTYICEHDEDGAMGIIINRPSDLKFNDLVKEFEAVETSELNTQPVMVGGPVGLERGFVLHQTPENTIEWLSTLQISQDIALTGSKDILTALGEGQGPDKFLFVLGYAGWGAGQLEQELMENDWLTCPATPEILFSTPYHLRAEAAAKSLGVDLSALATQPGNA